MLGGVATLVLTAGGGVGRCLMSGDLTDVRERPRGNSTRGQGNRMGAGMRRQCGSAARAQGAGQQARGG